jgi:hypothetical protein
MIMKLGAGRSELGGTVAASLCRRVGCDFVVASPKHAADFPFLSLRERIEVRAMSRINL